MTVMACDSQGGWKVAIERCARFLLPAAMMFVLAGCGGSTVNVQNEPPPPLSKVSIAFQPAPVASIQISGSAPLTAVVTNDPTNAGVDWQVACPVIGQCGTLSAPHTSSGQGTIYTPPSALSGNTQTFTVVAFATADHSQNVTAPISVTAFGVNLQGTFVLQVQGIDSSLQPYQFAGVVVLDGNGGVTSGEQTVNFFDQNPNIETSISKSDPITGGSYFLGPDGRGTITVHTADTDIGASNGNIGNGTETFTFVSLSSSQALVAQVDFGGATTTTSGTGTMDLQTSVATPTGGYAFVVSGTDIATASPTAMGGIFNIDSPHTISGSGSTSDQNLAGVVSAKKRLSGTVSDPDAFGAVTLTLNAGYETSPIQFTGYIVDATNIKIIESDNTIGGTDVGSTGGLAIAQGGATGTFATPASFSGTYVFGVLGEDLSVFIPATVTSVGSFTADGNGGLANGFTDTFLWGAATQASATFDGTYSIDSAGTGRVQVNFSHLSPHPTPAYQPVLFLYLTGNGNPPLFLDSGGVNYPSLGAGIAYPRSTGSLSFNGDYGFSFTQQNGSETDGTGQFTASATANTISGVADFNSGFSLSAGQTLNDTFVSPDANGRFAGTLFNSTIAVEYYIIDANHGFFVETDLVNPGSGQVSFGYYAARTPVCAGCQ
jgi:hypothetical protein